MRKIIKNMEFFKNFYEKNYGIALGGGAARGLVHIGVLKFLEEKNITITEIAGTSMGAIIGSLFAIGKHSDEIREIAKNINYLKLIDFDLKNGFVKGEKVKQELEEIFGDEKIENTKIPLKIVSTNFEKNTKKIFTSGKIADAVRASISLPGIFRPYEIDGESFIDGGVVKNLPIDEISTKHKIGVSALKITNWPLEQTRKILGFEVDNGFWNINFQIMTRTLALMMKQNEEISVAKSWENTQILRFEYGELDFMDFDDVDDFITLWYENAKKSLKV